MVEISDGKTKMSHTFKYKEFARKIFSVKYEDVVKYMYQPTDPSSLGVIRFFFGLLMLVDIPEERGGSDIDIRWGNPMQCHFPLFPILKPLSFSSMGILYGIMWLGALGIMLGYKFRLSIFLFGVPYWYILLLDKSFWNNHSYLYGVVTILLMGSSANQFFSIDCLLDSSIGNRHIPYWNYFILKFQFFMLYFLAGLKKTDSEWLEGYSMMHLGHHWVFMPFQLFLRPDQIDYLVVHWFGFLLDLTIGFWMLVEFTRPVAMIFCAMFHLMNSRLFSIGMFPYVCLATMPLFCDESWPRRIQRLFTKTDVEPLPSKSCIYSNEDLSRWKDHILERNISWKHKLVVGLLLTHCGLQSFLPYSHFITKGYNNWTNGLYGYSWDMMVHSWDTVMVVVRVVDNESGNEHYIDSSAWMLNDRWNKHADMCLQFAECLKNNLLRPLKSEDRSNDHENHLGKTKSPTQHYAFSRNLSVYIDMWCSMNKRFQQRMYDPNYDLLKANWSPFKPVEWLLPILTEYNNFREKMQEISQHVHSWSNYSDVVFIADFPGLYLENFISEDLSNVSLTILEGEVIYEVEDEFLLQSMGEKLRKGESVTVEVGVFHKVHTISSTPSCYMYTFSKEDNTMQEDVVIPPYISYSPFPIIENVEERIEGVTRMAKLVGASVLNVLFGIPIHIRNTE